MTREFLRDPQAIKQVFGPGALPEAYVADASTDDDRYYAPLFDTVGTRPLPSSSVEPNLSRALTPGLDAAATRS